MHKTVIYIIWLITLIIIGVMGFNQYFAKKELEYKLIEAEREIFKLKETLSTLKHEIDEDKNFLTFLSDRDIKNLKEKGLNNPVEDLIENLSHRNDIIPVEGIMGGTMRFYDTSSIFVISNKWVIAYFEDGHIAGITLLQYTVENGEIFWKQLNYHML